MTPNDPTSVVEVYLQAKVDRDEDQLRNLLCSEMEAEFERELQSFELVSGVRIQNMECQSEDNRVRCTGQIVADYGEESLVFELGNYRVVQEDGQWKWCGEAP